MDTLAGVTVEKRRCEVYVDTTAIAPMPGGICGSESPLKTYLAAKHNDVLNTMAKKLLLEVERGEEISHQNGLECKHSDKREHEDMSAAR
jgi:hypothetical protein